MPKKKTTDTSFITDPRATIQAIFDNAADGIMTTDKHGVIESFNAAAGRLFGYEPDQIAGENIRKLIPRPYLPEHESYHPEGRIKGQDPSIGREVTAIHKDGHTFPVDLSVSHFQSDSHEHSTVIVRDITERKQAQAELTNSRQLLRHLAAHLQTIREEERTRIAREIHDELGQSLTGVKMDIAWLVPRLSDRPDLTRRVKAMSDLIDDTIQSVRKIASDLRPGVLDNLGLVAAIEWQASEFQSRTGIECRCSAELKEDQLTPSLKTHFFRIFQETLTNVMRHAQATSVRVTLNQTPGHILLEVKDNGRGITDEERIGSKSLGLLGMRERVLIFGGDFTIDGTPGLGTTVRVRIPVSDFTQPEHGSRTFRPRPRS